MTDLPPEETLDPADWESLRALGHRMVDDALDWLRDVRERPVWQPIPDAVRASFQAPAPRTPSDPAAIYRDFTERVLPYPMGNVHPRFWGWVIGTGTPFGALADLLAATMNPNCGGADHSGTLVEHQVLDWLKELLGVPMEASGLLVSGGSMANLVGLTVARNVAGGADIRKVGVAGAPGRLVMYASTEAHSSVRKAAELLGLGTDGLRLIPVDADYAVDVAALERAVAADRAAGLTPVCVIGNAGTVNTGAFDDLDRLADLCAREHLWFHVDGAFGALAALVPAYRDRLRVLARADSVAFDLHKWMYVPFEAGCILVRHPKEHHDSFAVAPGYLARARGGLAAATVWPSDYGVELSRGFKALKVWMSLQEHGADRYGRLIAQNIAQARYLAGLVDAEAELERMAPVPLNIVCFRFTGRGGGARDMDELNRELLIRLHESGVAVPSSVTLHGRSGIRVAITNHRSRREDFDLLVRETLRLGRELVSGA
ncbi:MAG TPA: pyridoxal-dependent decarboxylase [Gemmatimonadales bacterium]|jgi:glutamate/tyrosine decarboxylase-like PLP-dependent enzyme|nr:pyridoxal-dependent decarboxylase [Gemmatimonadales bacterium]